MVSKKVAPNLSNKTEVSLVRSSAAEYLTFIAASGQGGVGEVFEADAGFGNDGFADHFKSVEGFGADDDAAIAAITDDQVAAVADDIAGYWRFFADCQHFL